MGRTLAELPVQTCEEVSRENDIDDGIAKEEDEVDAKHSALDVRRWYAGKEVNWRHQPILKILGTGSNFKERKSNEDCTDNMHPYLRIYIWGVPPLIEYHSLGQ